VADPFDLAHQRRQRRDAPLALLHRALQGRAYPAQLALAFDDALREPGRDPLEVLDPPLPPGQLDSAGLDLGALEADLLLRGLEPLAARLELRGLRRDRFVDLAPAVSEQRPLERPLGDAVTLGLAPDGNCCQHRTVPYPRRTETERLLLRRWEAGDLDVYRSIWADQGVRAVLDPDGEPDAEYVDSRFRRQVEHWNRHGFGLWLAIDRESGEAAGWIGAWYPDFIPELIGEVEVGWALRRRFWGRGLATEGARPALEAAFEHLDLDHVISIIAPSNARSIRVASKLGERRRETVRHPEAGLELDVYELSRSSRGASPQSASSR
jgi:RimJ/RimL family protein N-acetyltransferase